MVVWFKSLFRHFQIRHLGVLMLANVFCLAASAASLGGPLAVREDPGVGTLILIAGLLITGQMLAVSGRLLDLRFSGGKPEKGGLLRAWGRGWAEGLVVGIALIVLFSLVFRSVPYYWEQGTAFGWFSLAVLGIGTLLFLGGIPYYLPVRRREGLGLAASAAAAFRLMNERPLTALSCALFSLFSIAASIGTLGLFPGWAGLAALHQGAYDHVTALRADPEAEPR